MYSLLLLVYACSWLWFTKFIFTHWYDWCYLTMLSIRIIFPYL